MRIVITLLLLFSSVTPCKAYDYDLVVIGAGAAGLTAIKAAQKYNKKIALIEKDKIGGNRILKGDIPSKTFITIATLAHNIQHGESFGIRTKTPDSIDQTYIFEYIDSIVKKVYEINTGDLINYQNTDILYGAPTFIDNHTINLNGQNVTSEHFIIATGRHPYTPPIKGITETPHVTSETFFEQRSLPKSMIIIGAGPLGTEMASALVDLGVEITLIMKHGLILPTFDFELIAMKMHDMEKDGVNIQCNMHAQKIYKRENIIIVECQDYKGKTHVFTAEGLFLALGRKPNVNDLNLESANIEFTNDGIVVNEHMQTTCENIYACGDVVGGINLLSRVAYYQAKIAVHNIFENQQNKKITANYTHVPKIIYTTSPIACAGLTEQEARKLYGNTISIYRIPYSNIDKAYIDNATQGMGKFICDKDGILVGVHIYGAHSGELLDALEVGKRFDTNYDDYLSKLQTSPSYFELIQKAQEQYRKQHMPQYHQYTIQSNSNWFPVWFTKGDPVNTCLENCEYNCITLLHDLCQIEWFIKKHGCPNTDKASKSKCKAKLKALCKDIEKHIAVLKKDTCK